MLQGTKVDLRARIESDVAVLHAGLHDDVETRMRASGAPWRPASLPHSTFIISQEPPEVATFTVVRHESDEVLGAALLWGIDTHNRMAHIGVSLLSAHRGRGYGTDVLVVLCRYGFKMLGLHRLQLETLADNAAMLGSARAAGFTVEGTMRESSWLNGGFCDDVVLGQIAEDWAPPAPGA